MTDRCAGAITTERLELSPLTLSDVPALWAYWQLPEVQEWLGFLPATVDELLEAKARDLDGGVVHTLVVRRGDDVIGEVSVGVQDAWAQSPVRAQAAGVEGWLAWLFHPDHAGRGYATEAANALLDLSFGPLGLRRVLASCFADNAASWRLMERLGMRRETVGRADSLHAERGWLDGLTYALLAEEWRPRDSRAG